jgi:PIN domain nuclease of toxin-antitoxin system
MQSVKYLLDTHTLLWAIGNTKELSKTVIQTIKNPDNNILVSAVSLWEISIKYSIGKLEIDFNIEKIPEYCNKMCFDLIPLDPIDALNSLKLPQKNNHKEPFDRMLIYQCIKYDYTLISTDSRLEMYNKDNLKYIW